MEISRDEMDRKYVKVYFDEENEFKIHFKDVIIGYEINHGINYKIVLRRDYRIV